MTSFSTSLNLLMCFIYDIYVYIVLLPPCEVCKSHKENDLKHSCFNFSHTFCRSHIAKKKTGVIVHLKNTSNVRRKIGMHLYILPA